MSVFDLFNLDGKTAIITGGGRGLGEYIAEALADAGANIVVCSRKLDACEQVSERLKEKGVKSMAFQCDVTNVEDIQHVVDETVHHFGSIDILVNNSGATWGAPVEDMPLEAWQKVIDVNVTGTFLMSQAAGKVMIKQGGGKIINIASVAGLGGIDPRIMNTIGYNTSKGAIITFTKDLAVKWGPHHINVNAIAPGFIPTKMSQVLIQYGGEKIIDGTPLKRLGTDQDIKGVALFLASGASDFVTGDTIIVDGGTHAM